MVDSVFIRDFGGCDIKGTLFHLERITVNMTGKGSTTFNGHIDADEDLGKITMVSGSWYFYTLEERDYLPTKGII